jgi:hypothetical protein
MAIPSIKKLFQPISDASTFALIACQRTGTHLLREILNTNPAIAVMAEVFSHFPRPVYWHNYVRTLPEGRYPAESPAEAMLLLDEYTKIIQQDVCEHSEWYGGPKPKLKCIGLDVKYNQLSCAAPVFNNLLGRPFLLDYLGTRGIQIVHLIRKNVMQTALSMLIANARKVWQNYDGSLIQGQFVIGAEELLDYMRWIQSERDEFRRLAQDLQIHECAYEDLIEDLGNVDQGGNVPEETTTLGPLAKFLDVPNRFRYNRTIHKAINRPYREIIENYDELLRAIEASEFSEFAKAA